MSYMVLSASISNAILTLQLQNAVQLIEINGLWEGSKLVAVSYRINNSRIATFVEDEKVSIELQKRSKPLRTSCKE